MKKFLTIAAVVMATMFAKADLYLYWTVDAGEFKNASYAEIWGGSVSVGTYVSVSDDVVGVVNGKGAGDTSLGSTTYNDYLVKLFDSNYTEIAVLSTAVSYSDYLSKYVYQDGAQAQRPATPASFSGFTAVGVIPEPTSGLMLLLGLAGLALKRKSV